MIKSLVVGVNGSELSKAAVRVAVEWARMLDASVTFLAILDVEGLTAGQSVGMMGSAFKAERDEKVLARWRERLTGALNDAAGAAQAAGVRYEARSIEGDPAEELAKEVHRHDALVIGRRAEPRSDHEPASSESMAEIVRDSPRPVIVAGSVHHQGSSVVVAYDGSSHASQALESFIASGMYADLPVLLLGVSDGKAAMEETLAGAFDYLRRHGREGSVHVVPESKGIAASILRFAEQQSAAMIVMGTHGVTGLKKKLLGSVSEGVVKKSSFPVFLER